jgi:hypothetical protein
MNPFSDLQTALGGLVGNDIAGFILGAVLVVFFIIVIPWAADPKGKDHSGNTLFIAVIVGMVISTLVGWFPVWVAFVIIVGLAWVIMDPMGTKTKAG